MPKKTIHVNGRTGEPTLIDDRGSAIVRAAKLPLNAKTMARYQAEAEAHRDAVHLVKVESDEDYAFADALLSDVHDRLKRAQSMKSDAIGPIKQGLAVIDAWFVPMLAALSEVKEHLKGAMGDYVIAKKEREIEARATATEAIKAGDTETAIEAMNTALVAPKPAGSKASVGFRWVVESIDPAALPAEYFVPDVARLQEIASEHTGDDPPSIPGVTFERKARIGAR